MKPKNQGLYILRDGTRVRVKEESFGFTCPSIPGYWNNEGIHSQSYQYDMCEAVIETRIVPLCGVGNFTYLRAKPDQPILVRGDQVFEVVSRDEAKRRYPGKSNKPEETTQNQNAMDFQIVFNPTQKVTIQVTAQGNRVSVTATDSKGRSGKITL